MRAALRQLLDAATDIFDPKPTPTREPVNALGSAATSVHKQVVLPLTIVVPTRDADRGDDRSVACFDRREGSCVAG